MQALIAQEGEVIVVQLVGRLDVETAEPFKQACLKYLLGKKVVFNFRQLSFVGSSGILPFLETMLCFAQASREPFMFCEMGIEFKKVFAASPLGGIEIFDEQNMAIRALLQPPPIGGQACAVHAVPMGASTVPRADERVAADEVGEKRDFGLLSLRHVPDEGPEEPGESLEDEEPAG